MDLVTFVSLKVLESSKTYTPPLTLGRHVSILRKYMHNTLLPLPDLLFPSSSPIMSHEAWKGVAKMSGYSLPSLTEQHHLFWGSLLVMNLH